MSWTIGKGDDGRALVIVSIDEGYRDPEMRAGRGTRVAIRFLGNYMMQSVEHRSTFEDTLQPLLEKYNGVLVAGITRTQPVSYTFLVYCESEHVDGDEVSIERNLRAVSVVTVAHDPKWEEYESWLPEKPRGLWRIPYFFEWVSVRVRRSILAQGSKRAK
jgi:hypothetical protein